MSTTPAHTIKRGRPSSESPPLNASTSRRPIILLVEDDACAASGLSRMLRDDGFDVERASDGAAAILRLGQRPFPDVLITDLYMPFADGLTVARVARAANPSIPIVVITGHAELMDARATAFMQVLAKPVDYEHLADMLRMMLPAAA